MTSICLVCQTLARSWERVPLCDVGLQVGASGRSLEPVSRQVRRCARSDRHAGPPLRSCPLGLHLISPLSVTRRYTPHIVSVVSNMANIRAI